MLAEFSSLTNKPFLGSLFLVAGYTDGLVAVHLHEQAFDEAVPRLKSFNRVNDGVDVVYLYVLIPYAF